MTSASGVRLELSFLSLILLWKKNGCVCKKLLGHIYSGVASLPYSLDENDAPLLVQLSVMMVQKDFVKLSFVKYTILNVRCQARPRSRQISGSEPRAAS
jgi:hypothetical protein